MLLLSKEKLVMLKHKYNRNILVADSDTYKYKTVNQQLFQFGITLNYFANKVSSIHIKVGAGKT